MGALSRGSFVRGRGLEALLVATLYVACTDPPNTTDREATGGKGGSTGGTVGGSSGTGGSNTGGSSGGTAGSSGGSGGSGGAKAGKGGTSGRGGSAGKVSTGGSGGSTGGDQGEGGMSAGMAGEGGVSGSEAGMGAASGQGGAGEAGAGPVDPCTTAVVGGQSIMHAPATSGVTQPNGTPGNLKVLNWAGFKGALSFTFDDNMQSLRTYYPNLAAVGVPLTFYLVCSTEGSNQVWHDAVAAGHELGNHTVNHCNANGSNCQFGSPATFDAGAQLDDCTAQLVSEYGLTGVYSMAAPQGDQGWATYGATRFLVDRGITTGTGMLPNNDSNAYDLECHISNTGETAVTSSTGGFNAITDSTASTGVWKTILIHGFSDAPDGAYQPVPISEAVAALTYAKGKRDSGDVWVDTVTAIAAYWRAQKVVSNATPVTSGGNITYSWTLPAHFPPGMYLRVTVDGGTVKQCGTDLAWNDHGYYEIALDAGSVTISP